MSNVLYNVDHTQNHTSTPTALKSYDPLISGQPVFMIRRPQIVEEEIL